MLFHRFTKLSCISCLCVIMLHSLYVLITVAAASEMANNRDLQTEEVSTLTIYTAIHAYRVYTTCKLMLSLQNAEFHAIMMRCSYEAQSHC
jgi:hypothetical protein